MTAPGPTFVDQLAAAATEAREVLGELRSEIRQVRKVLREIAAERAEVESMVRRSVQDELDDKVREAVESLGECTQQAMNDSVAKVGREFDKLRNILLTGDRRGHAQDGFDIGRLIEEGKIP